MAEGTYEAACMRAELLGLEKPSKNDFVHIHPQRLDDQIEAAQFEEVSLQNDDLKNVGGGLNELNSILSVTQRRLNKLKGVCGSLTDLIKNKLGGSKDNMSYSCDANAAASGSGSAYGGGSINQALDDLDTMKEAQNRSSDMNQQITSQVDKLDSLLDKAEHAQYTMSQQNKQMKKFLK